MADCKGRQANKQACRPAPPQILGLDYKAANMLSDVLAAPALSWLPAEMRKGVLETTMAVGKAAASPIRCVRGRRPLNPPRCAPETILGMPKNRLGRAVACGARAVVQSHVEAHAALPSPGMAVLRGSMHVHTHGHCARAAGRLCKSGAGGTFAGRQEQLVHSWVPQHRAAPPQAAAPV